ncbi:MAG: GntR family transcriptional regulator, partial [Ilumatobacteraceae bacterium]
MPRTVMTHPKLDNTSFVTVRSGAIVAPHTRSLGTHGTAAPLASGLVTGIFNEIATAGDDRSARGIAAVIGRMISAGQLADGTRLPTVRDLARRLGVSPTTVSDAWRS